MSKRRQAQENAGIVSTPQLARGALRQSAPRARRTTVADAPGIADDWPAAVPVAAREIEVVETYLGALLDELLGGTTLDE